jgi:putative oxidoreductase
MDCLRLMQTRNAKQKLKVTLKMQTGKIITWVLRVSLFGLFTLSATQKFINDPQYISEFAKVGFGDWFRYVTAVLEMIGAIALLYPRTTTKGAYLLLLVTFGAFIAQITALHVGWYHCAGIAAALIALVYLERAAQHEK